ncbi:hypothetical protein MMA231_02524 [Asticcacaulis sp. MM231]
MRTTSTLSSFWTNTIRRNQSFKLYVLKEKNGDGTIKAMVDLSPEALLADRLNRIAENGDALVEPFQLFL